ncbi:condensin-2 complex subunit D3-like isoform X2 [Pararge aegeria]|uniref:condensin-2 complex subunit D3-like isoform X2 n=1 Tax=Pararge aegeria TaxID=116150 RepID=UPI0019D2CF04|nr:condensin-2 complex subunit D3-like isoform X2 [Pararge aegeria]
MENVLEKLYELQLDHLNDEWVDGIFYSEFMEFGELPAEYESVLESMDLRATFRSIMKAINAWLRNESDDEERSWTHLSNQVKHQNLLAVLAYFIDVGSKNVTSKEHRNNAILACRVYFKLLSIPGYKAYHIYHSQLFAHSLLCLSYPKSMCDNEDNYFNTRELTLEVDSVIKELGNYVSELRAIIKDLHLNPNDMNFEDILSNLVDITGGAIVNKLHIDKVELGNISKVIYEIINILICEPNGNPSSVAIQLLFKCLLPKFIAASLDTRNANNIVKASYVTYSGLLLTKYGKAALSGYIVLLQHLCYTPDGLEKAEVRTARVSLVVGLMSLLPHKSYKKIVKWLLTLSTTAKITHRQIALEMLSKLLNNEPEEPKRTLPNENNEAEQTPGTASGEVTNEQSEQAPENLPPTVNIDEPQPGPSGTQDVLTEDESSQELPPFNENEEVTEEEVAGLLRQRSHTIAHGDVLRAVYERLHDISSTLRTRALTILTECLSSDYQPMKDAIKELNGDGEVSRLAAVGAQCVCDERAVVRKAAVGLIHRLILVRTASGNTPQPSEYAMLVGLCRDASIVVRVAAIAAIGELVTHRPSDEFVDAFLTGPMHQLSDPETKIQEQVVSIIESILVNRFEKYDANRTEDPLPWMFLTGVARHNMKKHLLNACALLLKSTSCINHRLVDLLSTHLGAVNDERDLQCLVLLVSIARHIKYSDVGFVLDYYYKLIDGQQRDARLLPLTLELLGTWSCCIGDTERRSLREHLVARLAAAVDDGCRTTCVSLAAQLDPDNLQWASELLQLSERRAVNGGSVSEWLRAADISLVAPLPPSTQLLQLFFNALVEPPQEWSDVERGECVAGAGRLCVRSRETATVLAPPIAALLKDARAPLCARHNALLALTDICTRYSCIVEPLLESVCGCLETATVGPLRRVAARSLTTLLLSGYLRLRTPLYYTYCALLADDDHDVREPAEYYVSCCLTVDAIYHHFVDCVLHYNKQTASISFDARQLIYDVMLQRMSLVQKLNVQCRLAREVLEHAAEICDEGEEIPAHLNAALLDTITLLCGPRMKLPKKPEKGGDADIDDLQERVTTNIVSHKMKRTVAEVLVPAVLRLYSHMRARGGQLATYLVRIATDLLNDYRHEIEELIENDEELVQRVQQFQETIGLEASFGNTRNLVTSSAPPEPVTPRAPRKRPASRYTAATPRKRALRI